MAGLALRVPCQRIRASRQFSISSTVTRKRREASCTSLRQVRLNDLSFTPKLTFKQYRKVWTKERKKEQEGGRRRKEEQGGGRRSKEEEGGEKRNKEGSSTHHGERDAPRRVSGTVPSHPPPSAPAHPEDSHRADAGADRRASKTFFALCPHDSIVPGSRFRFCGIEVLIF